MKSWLRCRAALFTAKNIPNFPYLSAIYSFVGRFPVVESENPAFASFPVVFVLVIGFWSSERKAGCELPRKATWLLREGTDDEDEDDDEDDSEI
jgi:hypothetical protein